MKQKKDKQGFYVLDDEYARELLLNDGIYLDNNIALSSIRADIWRIWKNQKEPLTNEILDNDSMVESNLSFKHFVFAEQYLIYGNITKVCKELNISRPTAYEWLKRDDVQKYLQERKQEKQDEFKQINDNLYMTCISEINDIVTGYNSNADKIKAIETYLKHYSNMERIKTLKKGGTDETIPVVITDDITE